MKALIDTHVFLWGLQNEKKLSRRVQGILPNSDLWISVASLWEIIAKAQVGKLKLPTPVGAYLS
ncbi:MAG: PIN domain-containing protein, partial [Candidatus Sulfotelmatobacter sp.]